MKLLKQSVFLCEDKNQLKFCQKIYSKEQLSSFCPFDESPFSNICTIKDVIMECIELNRLSEHLKNVGRKCPQSGIRTVNEKAQPYVV